MTKEVPHVEAKGAEAWEAFRQTGLLWFVNRMLHVFNWSIIVSYDDDDNVVGAWPARTTWKGFPRDMEEEGYEKVDRFLKEEFKMGEKVISPGSLVRLRSGGPQMTVGNYGMDMELTCYWFDEADNLQFSSFAPAALVEDLGTSEFDQYAMQAYGAYGDAADWKNYQGNPMPVWTELPENIRQYWRAAVVDTISRVNAESNNRRR